MKININGKEYKLRSKSLLDIMAYKEMFGSDMKGLMDGEFINLESVAKAVYQLIEDKSDFKQINDFDIDGKPVTFGGYKYLLKGLDSTEGKAKLLEAFNSIFGEKESGE